MAVIAKRGQKKKTILPHSMQSGLKSMANKAIGSAFVIVSLLCWASLLTWSVSDQSLNRASDGTVKNILGHPGAIFSDILFQSYGLTAILFILPIAILGLRLLNNSPVSYWRLRILSWPFSISLMAATLTLIPVSQTWPLLQSYGGIIGDTVAKIFQLDLLANSSVIHLIATFIVMITISVVALSFTTSIRVKDAQILFSTDDPEGLKALLKAPIRRFAYWWRRREVMTAPTTNHHQRLWWRNANDDEPDQSYAPEHGLAIHPVAQRPNRPEDFKKPQQNGFKCAGHNQIETEPMSARPKYQMAEAVHPYEFEPVNPGLGNAVSPGPDAANRKATANPLSALKQKSPHEFILPPIELLNAPQQQHTPTISADDLRNMAVMLENVLLDFGVKGSILNVRPGPVVTLFEFEPARGTKTSRIVGLADDIARSMSAYSARIAVIPGRNAIGIELPNETSEIVFLRELVETSEFYHAEHPLPLILGKSIGGEPIITDLSSMPHLLIAGTTGSGKSVGINTMLLSLLYRLTPKECRMIMIDPKMLELSIYDGIPHLLTPVVTDPHKALAALKWAVKEMEDRYRQMSKLGVRNIDGFNQRVKKANENGEPITRTVQTGFDQQTGRAIFEEEHLTFEPMPMIVVVIDEMADLMMVAGKEIEAAVQRLAQMARAAGIHVIMATQRPSVDVITGTIKANFPTRISFQVTSKIDSRTILGKEGAEQLLGRGDMLFMSGGNRTQRVHGAYVDDLEVEHVVQHLRAQGAPEYLDNITIDETSENNLDNPKAKGDIYDEAIEIVIRDQKASISYLQRRLSIGYNRAATLIERMEDEGIVSPANKSGKREILMNQ